MSKEATYQELVQAFMRRQHIRVVVSFPTANKLVLMPVRATLNDLYRQVDAPKTTTQLYCEDGTGISRTDEYVSHYIQRMQMAPWHQRPPVYRVLGFTAPLEALQIVTPQTVVVATPIDPPQQQQALDETQMQACETPDVNEAGQDARTLEALAASLQKATDWAQAAPAPPPTPTSQGLGHSDH